jgi:hypothetical protein
MLELACHPERAFFAQRRIWASRALCRVLCDTIVARLARFFILLEVCGRLLSSTEEF